MFLSNDVNINIDDIKRCLSDESIYNAYCSDFTLNRKIKSPFRSERDPSFNFFRGDRGIMWKDHGGSGEAGDSIKFVRKCLELSGQPSDLKSALNDINSRFALGLNFGIKPIVDLSIKKEGFLNKNPILKQKRIISVEDKPFSDFELNYWQSYGIGFPYLNMYNVGSAKKVYLDGICTHISTDKSPVFYYYFPETNNYKIYRPMSKSKKKKWLSNTFSDLDTQGFKQCQFGNKKIKLLILTKAMKEVIFFRTFGIDAIAIQGENHRFSSATIDYFKKHCDVIISFYDRDTSGVAGATDLFNRFGIEGVLLPKHFNSKNITDLYLISPKKVIQFINYIKYIYGVQ